MGASTPFACHEAAQVCLEVAHDGCTTAPQRLQTLILVSIQAFDGMPASWTRDGLEQMQLPTVASHSFGLGLCPTCHDVEALQLFTDRFLFAMATRVLQPATRKPPTGLKDPLLVSMRELPPIGARMIFVARSHAQADCPRWNHLLPESAGIFGQHAP